MKKSNDNTIKSTNSGSADLIKLQEQHDKFYQIWQPVEDVLTEIGIARGPLEIANGIKLATVEEATQQLTAFIGCEAMELFQHASRLQPPGVLARWAQDELTRSARETGVYIRARKLVREVYRDSYPVLRRLIKRSYHNGTPIRQECTGSES